MFYTAISCEAFITKSEPMFVLKGKYIISSISKLTWSFSRVLLVRLSLRGIHSKSFNILQKLGGGISNKSNSIVIRQKILFVGKKKTTKYRVGRGGGLHAHCKKWG